MIYIYKTSKQEARNIIHNGHLSLNQAFSKMRDEDNAIISYFENETWKSEGCVQIKHRIPINDNPFLACIPFIEYYSTNVKPNEEALIAIETIKQVSMPNYKTGTEYLFLFCEKAVEYMIKHSTYPPFELIDEPQRQKTGKFLEEIDCWLRNVGVLYDEKVFLSDTVVFDVTKTGLITITEDYKSLKRKEV